MEKVTIEFALSKRPENLGEVEPELKIPPPRNKIWENTFGEMISQSSQDMANNWTALRGWIVKSEVKYDGYDPDYQITLAYEFERKVYIKSFSIGYDHYSWCSIYGSHAHWFHTTMKEGNSLTILVDPLQHDDYQIFGQLETFRIVRATKRWLANEGGSGVEDTEPVRDDQITEAYAISIRPVSPGEIETEVNCPPPRNGVWKDAFGQKIAKNDRAKADYWTAVRGWVVNVQKTLSDNATNFDIHFAYEIDGKLIIGSLSTSFDKTLSPANVNHQTWFVNTMKVGNSLTLLVNPENPEDSIVFGQMQIFEHLEEKKYWIAR